MRTKHKPEIPISKPKRTRGRGAGSPASIWDGRVGKSSYDDVRYPHIAKVLMQEKGLTYAVLGRVFSVSERTIKKWMSTYPAFKAAVSEGRDEYDGINVESALLRRALGYRYKETTKKRVYVDAKCPEGYVVKLPAREVITTEKELPPDSKSAIFWLANRNADRWKIQSNVKVDASLEQKNTTISIEADLDSMNTDQLLALRELVAITSGKGKQEADSKIIDAIPIDGYLDTADTLQIGYNPLDDDDED